MRILIDATGLQASPEAALRFRRVVRSLLLAGGSTTYALTGWPERAEWDPARLLSPLPRGASRRIALREEPRAVREAQAPQASAYEARAPEAADGGPEVLYAPLGIPRESRALERGPVVATFLSSGLEDDTRPLAPGARVALQQVHRVLTLTRRTRERLLRGEGLSPERVTWVPPGTGPSDLALRPSGDSPVPDVPYIVTTGQVSSARNFAGILDAFRLYRRHSRRRIRLVVLGRAPLRMRWLAWWRGIHRHVDFAGDIDDYHRARTIASAGAFVAADHGDLSWFCAAEALAWGVPVVAVREPRLQEILGDAAIYSSPGCPGELALELSRCLECEDLSRVLAQRGIARARAFSWELCALRLLDLFAEVSAEWAGYNSCTHESPLEAPACL